MKRFEFYTNYKNVKTKIIVNGFDEIEKYFENNILHKHINL